MTANSKIEWTDHTFNPWIGCTKVGPGCDHCYAEAQNARFGGGNWGPRAPRRRTSPKNWLEPLKWDKAAATAGKPAFVFCASMADVFDNKADDATRAELWALMQDTPNLVWIIVTKRGVNVASMIPDHWYKGQWPANIWLLYTICNQDEADRMVPLLLDQKAKYHIPVVGLSMEPLLGPVDFYITSAAMPFNGHPWRNGPILQGIDWIIVGGESGRDARPMHPDWARSLRDQCEAAGVHFFFKQWGEWVWLDDGKQPGTALWPTDGISRAVCCKDFDPDFYRVGKKEAGRMIDGAIHDSRPEAAL